MTANGAAIRVLVGFGTALREAGVQVSTGQLTAYSRAIVQLDPADSDDLYWAGRTCLISRHDDIRTYDVVFRRYFSGTRDELRLITSGALPRSAVIEVPRAQLRTSMAQRHNRTPTGNRASDAELLRHKHFRDCTPDELAVLQALMARLRLTPPTRRRRRTRRSARGDELDLRRMVRRTLHGSVASPKPPWRQPRTRLRRLVLILDVSGSMADYSRALLQFAYSAAAASVPRTEVFCFGTRLTRITRELRHRNPDAALAQAADAVMDWDGGTRIGESLRTFTRVWGRRGLARGAVVVICSDGLECGDPEILERAMARLARLAYRIVWVNPLKGDPRYQPIARGMQAALPYVDVFVSGHDLSSLEDLAELLPQLA
ncbi:MAG TPA: VWA domain-containing protein [Actinomycetes bacterium]|nr:VWA domain-containing protein [Actinomycetes bacterium]